MDNHVDVSYQNRPQKPANFKLVSKFKPNGDQPGAIQSLLGGIKENEKDQILLGVTGSGKTFTIAHVIEQTKRPTLILAPNKTLAAQLYGEMKALFPGNAVEYFVSYYDYYQPEAYVPRSDLFIEKESSINEQIDRLRHSATRSLLERDDVIIVASVSCIYGIGSVETYSEMTLRLQTNGELERQKFLRRLTELQYKRNDMNFVRGTFRVRGDNIELFPAHLEDRAWRISLFGNDIEEIWEFDPLTGEKTNSLEKITKLSGYEYNWNSIAQEMYPERTKRDVGVIAQEVQEVLPSAVVEREDGYLAISYDSLIPLLIESIKTLKTEIDTLKGGQQ